MSSVYTYTEQIVKNKETAGIGANQYEREYFSYEYDYQCECACACECECESNDNQLFTVFNIAHKH